jgi:cinnamyl-alcohol dehydrogenase
MATTGKHTQRVSGWAAMNESGKVEPFVFKRRFTIIVQQLIVR